MNKIATLVSIKKAPELRKILRASLFVLVAASAVGNASAAAVSVDLAHWAANGGWSSVWSVVNTLSGPIGCTLRINGPDGKPLSLVTSAGTGSSITFTVAQGGTAQIQAGSATGAVQSGSSNVSCDGAFTADLTYTWMPAGVALTEVSVLPVGRFSNYIFAANAFTGIALYEPGSNAATATVSANDTSGKLVGTAMLTVPALGKATANLNKLITNLPSSFVGSVTVALDHGVELVAIDVTPGADGSFVIGNVPVVAFDAQPPSFSGTYHFLSGPLAGQTGTFSLTGMSPVGNLFGSATYLAIATSGSSTDEATIDEMNNGIGVVHFFNSSSFAPLAGGIASVTQQSDGTYAGSIYVPAATGGSVGTVTVN
jgi:hypothetical protein